ncbi:MAG TPA: peptidoglycan-associated lipoprotein Pal [Thermoanaerobaculia bacterium]|jgi:peptidoglycan-associated lipoprotein|nr:peptidoglycan-associated lipoprotein Pal [Thermoanaerobaculia bacterium]
MNPIVPLTIRKPKKMLPYGGSTEMKKPATARLLLVAGALAVVVACTPKPKPQAPPPEPTPAPVATPTEIKNDQTFQPTPTPEPKDSTLQEGLDALNRKGYLKDVFFDFDKADVRSDQRDALAGNADWLKKYPTVKFRIEGHCDERGTSQYNLALGDKRANSAKDYLISLGVEASRVETVSYGKERPFAPGHDESAWAQNRRAHFVITAK